MANQYTCDCKLDDVRSATVEDNESSRISNDRFVHEAELCDDCAFITNNYFYKKPTKAEKKEIEEEHERRRKVYEDMMYND